MKKNLSIVTFNTLGAPFAPDITKRYIKAAQLLNEKDYDIICLQELFTYYHLFIFRKYLKNFPFVTYQKNPLGPKGGLVIFSKFQLINKEYFSYSHPENAFIPFYVYLAQPGILSASIKPLDIRIATTHLSSDIVSNLSPKNKLYKLIHSQLIGAAKEINRYTKNGISLILAGDFNTAKHSKLHTDLMRNTGLNDVFEKDERPTYSPDRVKFFYAQTSGRIDFIFAKSEQIKMNPLHTEYLFTEEEILSNDKKSYLSDHIALHCILGVNK